MSLEIGKYTEPLNSNELQFLTDKELKERGQYFRIYRMLMITSFVVPFIASWYRAYEGAPNAFSGTRFFVSAGILLFISSFSVYYSYRLNLRKIQLDIRDRTKTIEKHHVTRKLFIPAKNTWYFYIDSRVKLSIEVTDADYQLIKEGDEVNIEYTTHSQLYLGYF